MAYEDYIKAGKIAGEVRENVRNTDWIGKTVYEICEYVESEIRKRGAKCAFPVNTCLLYTSPSPRDISGSRMPSSA